MKVKHVQLVYHNLWVSDDIKQRAVVFHLVVVSAEGIFDYRL